MANKYISKRLQKARRDAGFSQREVYQWLGVGQSTFSAWETGLGEPSVEVFLRLCRKYGVRDIAGYFLPEDSGEAGDQLDAAFVNKLLALPPLGQAAVRNCLDFEYSHRPVAAGSTLRRVRKIPLFTQAAAAGLGNYTDSADSEVRELEAPEEASFAIRISGNSMEPAIHDGEIVFVRQQPELASGEIGVFTYNGESYCKMWENRNGIPKLVSLNPDYGPILLQPADRLVIHGKVLL